MSWIARGMAQLSANPARALADFRRALELQPGSRKALNNIVHVLADRLGRNEEAAQYLDAMIAANPNDARALASRAVTRARLGQREEAIVDAEAAVKIAAEPKVLMQAACVYALASREQSDLVRNAMTFLSKALGADPALASRAMSDPDLESLRKSDAFKSVIDAAIVLSRRGVNVTAADASPK
jgi:tetratricopeptide (TPR) repeat protein